MNTVHIVHLYPKEMNIYGDNGNILVLKKRLEWRGFSVSIHKVGVGDALPDTVHLVLGGGGQDQGQSIIATDLQDKAGRLHELAKTGVPMLMICGMYQMFGHYFKTATGEKIPGIGIIDIHTVAGSGRLIGNVVEKTEQWGELVGYENHSGLTDLGVHASNLGLVPKLQGNNGLDTTEGAIQNNVFGSYLHGPMLAKSPVFADYLLAQALQKAGINTDLAPLDDALEFRSARVAKSRQR